jgi:predicted DNA-binding transcriptional regulator AlpA
MPRKKVTQTSAPDAWRPSHALLTAQRSAQAVGLSTPAFWKGVKDQRFPAPVYPAPRAPRWFEHELLAAVERTRSLPSEAMAARRSARILRNCGTDPHLAPQNTGGDR